MLNYTIEDSRIYALDDNGTLMAEVTFPAHDGIAVIDHTYVDNSLRGQGIASKLVQMAVDKIIADGKKLAATCVYAIAWLERHPEYQVENTDAPIACRIDKRR